MMFRKKKQEINFYNEVDDSHYIVYDFRRRTYRLFENYRAIGYKKLPFYDLESQKQKNAEILAKLMKAKAVDSANEDCLLDIIFGPIRDGFRYLEDQWIKHQDFYIRQAQRAGRDGEDLKNMIALWNGKLEEMEQEHEKTKVLWNKYFGAKKKEA